jgi:hypothetical protein
MHAGEGIGNHIVGASLIFDIGAANLLKDVEPAGLATREVGLRMDVPQRLVVRVDDELSSV